MDYGLGLLTGLFITVLALFVTHYGELKEIYELKKKIEQIEFVLTSGRVMCGEGFHCNGGPNCTSDHK